MYSMDKMLLYKCHFSLKLINLPTNVYKQN